MDQQEWQSLIDAIKENYRNDEFVETRPRYLVFKTGEHPQLPFEGHKFLRFSSKNSGSHAEGVEKYIDTVTRIVKAKFGSRVKYWNGAFDGTGFYNWQDGNDSFETYGQTEKPDNPTREAQFALGPDPLTEVDKQVFAIQYLHHLHTTLN